jgi:hypothetical protein
MSLLLEDSDTIELMKFATPRAVEPLCSFVKGRSGWVITASGGVDINGFAVVEKQRIDGQVAETRSSALAAATDRWWWDK